MFSDCSSLTSINIKFFEIKKFENSESKNIFINCNKLQTSYINKIESLINNINDICIIGLWYGCNYGSMLTYYALHETIKRLGYSVLMIDDPLEPDNITLTRIHPKSITKSLYKISEKKKLFNLNELNKNCKCFLVGSDQLWNIKLSRSLDQFYFLGFADDDKIKISYGTSFGTKYNGTEDEKNRTKINLKRFYGISVRDELSLEILKDTFKIENGVQACDPTFLCQLSDYIYLANKANINITENYILAYVLDTS